ncbi:DUF3006 domain-containing protein [Clostridium sediminicola]|uniref:DUF3006 domain-containing protein n=1 Tax=Clostridium sediminicola TaxID=3114879 RepID=UPI0031F248D9
MLGIIDRFEEDLAVVELYTGDIINVERKRVPKEAVEGYVLNIDTEITINQIETEKRRKEIEELTKDIWEE